MFKPTVRELKSHEHASGHVYTLIIDKAPGLHESIVSCLLALGVEADGALEFDIDLAQCDADVFIAQEGLRVHLIARESEVLLILDVAQSFTKVISVVSSYFTLLKELKNHQRSANHF